jgi:hypothetical protein
MVYLENTSNLELEMTPGAGQGHGARGGDAAGGNFGELRLLEGFSERRESQKLQGNAAPEPGSCALHVDGFGAARQEDGYAPLTHRSALCALHG